MKTTSIKEIWFIYLRTDILGDGGGIELLFRGLRVPRTFLVAEREAEQNSCIQCKVSIIQGVCLFVFILVGTL